MVTGRVEADVITAGSSLTVKGEPVATMETLALTEKVLTGRIDSLRGNVDGVVLRLMDRVSALEARSTETEAAPRKLGNAPAYVDAAWSDVMEGMDKLRDCHPFHRTMAEHVLLDRISAYGQACRTWGCLERSREPGA